MSTHEQITNNPTSAVRNTGGRNGPQGLEEPISDEVLREMCDKNYHQLLPLIAEKMQKEKEQKDKLNAVKARLIYGEESGVKIRSHEESHYSESKTPTARTEPRRRRGDRYSRSPSPHASVFKRLRRNRSPSPRPRPRKEGGVFNRLGRREPATSARPDSRQQKGTPSRTTSQYSESEDSEGGHWKSKPRRQKSNTYEDDLSQPWTCEERNPFTPRIRHFSLPRTRMPSHVKTYDGSGDPEDHLKLFQSAAKTEAWAMPTWCHMFNSTLTGNARVWFDKLPKESIDSYEDLRTAFRENYLQQTKHIKDPVEIHHIKQRDGESTEDFMERYKAEVLDVEGAPECMRISRFMHGITHPGLIKRLYERIPRSVDEMYRMTTSFLQGEVAALSHGRRKASSSWKPFSLLTKTPKEIFALEKGKFKAPPPMVTPVEKRDPSKYCEFHSDTGHNTNECMQLRKQIDEMIKAGKLSQFIKELKQNDKPKAPKKGEASGKDKPLTILMIQPWERVAKPRITQSFSPETAMSFPPLSEEDGTESPMIVEVEMGGHFVHRVYIDGGASSEVLYEHCFIKLRKEIRDQMVPATTHLIGFSGETISPLGQIAWLVKIGDEVHSTSAWMNFMVIRSPSQHNAIIGRPGIRKIRAVPSTAHGMLKFPVEGGTVTLQSSRVIPMECAMISGPSIQPPAVNQVLEEKINIAIHPEYPEQTVAIGSTLTEKGRKELCSLLKQNLDIFAWKPADMTGVPRNIAEHRLNIREGYSPVRQKKRGQAPERNKVIQEEVEKLVDAGIMKEVHYHSWLSNPVMVKKHDGTWRMCVDFKDLNNACPKDCYPLPEIDWKVESLCGFLSKSAEKSLPFFKTLKKCTKKSDFQWTPEAEEAFKQMKKLIAELPTLTAPRENEELIIYLAAAKEAISAVLMTDREGRQIPVYFVSRTLRGPEVNYTPMEKLVLALLSASKRLKRYFQAHTVVVITNQPIKQLLSSSEISGRMLKWKFELEGYDIQYRPRTAIKGQILADFIVERPEEESPDELMAEPEVLPEPWTLFTDGSSCVDGSGAGLILTNPEGAEFTYAMRFRFEATNNEAEYEALIAGLRIAEKMGIKNLQANVDSKLVANQVNGSYIAKESGMVQYLNKVKTLAKSFKEFSIKQIPRSENKKADALSKIASTSFAHLNKQVLVEELKEKSINEKEILDIVEEEGNTWMTPICEYLTKEILPEDKKKARAVRRKAANMHSGPRSVVAKVIQTGYYWPTMHMDARNLIRECNDCQIHRPVPRNPQQNLTPITSPWPFYKWGIDIAGPFPEGPGSQAAIQEAKSKKKMENITTKESVGQVSSLVIWSTAAMKQVMLRTKANLDPNGKGSYEANYFIAFGKRNFLTYAEEEGNTWMTTSMWSTSKRNPYLEDKKRANRYAWKAPNMHSGPRSMVAKVIQTGYYWPTMHMDARNLIRECNDCQIHRPVLRNPQQNLTPITSPWPFYKWGIEIAGPFPEGPGKVKFLIVAIDYFTKWIEAKAVATITGNQVKTFAHRIIIESSNGETPFSLTYDTEAVIPTEIGMPTLRTAEIDQAKNNEALGINLDLIEERREQAAIQEAKSKKKMEKYYNSRVRGTSFKPGDMVYRSNEASHAKDEGKLGPKWEGPYEVKESLGKGAYKLKDRKGNEMPRTWNICNLKKCYIHEV
ncbi:reverse transcriptase domain-containing protein [Tanacetum coccineum]